MYNKGLVAGNVQNKGAGFFVTGGNKLVDDKRIKVLLIEDSASAREIILDMLAEAKYSSFEVELADRLSTGLEILSRGGIDAVLLDLGLPDSSGLDTFTSVQAYSPMTPIVILTSLDDKELILTMAQSGAQDYLIKNKVNGYILERSVRYAIERKRSEEELRKARDELETRVRERTEELVRTNEELREKMIGRRLAEEALQKSEEKHRLVVENAGEGIVIMQDLKHRFFNSKALEITGYSSEEYASTSPIEIVHQDDRNELIESLQEFIQGKETTLTSEYRIIDKSGSIKWIEQTMAVMEWGGKPALLSIIHDITDRKLSEKLLDERMRLEALRADVSAAFTRGDRLGISLQGCAAAPVERLDAALCRIWLINEAEEVLELVASAGLSDNIRGYHSCLSLDQSKIGQITRSRRSLLINPLAGNPLIHDQEWAQREGLEAFAGNPMIVDDAVIGVIGLFFRAPITEITFKALTSIAERIGLGIKNKQIQVQLQEAHGELETKANELEQLNQELADYAVMALDANPLTQLPGNNTIIKKIQEAIDARKALAVIYCDLDYFKRYNDRYGFSAGDRVISFMAAAIQKAVIKACEEETFLGHIGGDDFMLLAPADSATALAEVIIRGFDEGIPEFYSQEEQEQGFFHIKNRLGELIPYPFMTVSIAGIILEPGRFTHHLQVSACCADVKTRAKSIDKSVYFVDRRRGKYDADSSIPKLQDKT